MKRLRAKKPIDVSRSKKEPLAEGLQFTVPTDSAGRRLWSRMRNEEIVELAKKHCTKIPSCDNCPLNKICKKNL